jgi:hypothetical protein
MFPHSGAVSFASFQFNKNQLVKECGNWIGLDLADYRLT